MGIRKKFYVDVMSVHPAVSGSCIICSVHFQDGRSNRFLIDCGLFQEMNYLKYNENLEFNAQKIDFVAVTHSHIDHVGKLPFIVTKGFFNKIFMTHGTYSFLKPQLKDSYKIMKLDAKKSNKKYLYNEEDIETVMNLADPHDYYETIKVNENINIIFFKNGHLPGAAMILVRIYDYKCQTINLLFTGDYKAKNRFTKIKSLPQWVRDLDLTIIQESTYGTTESYEIDSGKYQENVLEAINLNKTVISPVLALGRTQEILYDLKVMQDKKLLDLNVPIYLDGKLARTFTQKYLRDDRLQILEHMKYFLPENFKYVDDDLRENLLKNRSRKIILTTSGMGSQGPAQRYIPEYITEKRALIQFTCYTAEGTAGRALKDVPKGEEVNAYGIILKKRADVEYTTEYSSHAKADEMIDFLKTFTNLRLVLVNHGEPKTKEIFAKRVKEEVNPDNIGILDRSFVFRINHYGLVSTMNTKFSD